LKRPPKNLHEEVSDPTRIYCDNLNSIHLARNPVVHARTKHIEVHYHFVRERVLSGEVEDELETANSDKAWSQEDRSRDPEEPQVELEGEC
jgi:hypothetical protein